MKKYFIYILFVFLSFVITINDVGAKSLSSVTIGDMYNDDDTCFMKSGYQTTLEYSDGTKVPSVAFCLDPGLATPESEIIYISPLKSFDAADDMYKQYLYFFNQVKDSEGRNILGNRASLEAAFRATMDNVVAGSYKNCIDAINGSGGFLAKTAGGNKCFESDSIFLAAQSYKKAILVAEKDTYSGFKEPELSIDGEPTDLEGDVKRYKFKFNWKNDSDKDLLDTSIYGGISLDGTSNRVISDPKLIIEKVTLIIDETEYKDEGKGGYFGGYSIGWKKIIKDDEEFHVDINLNKITSDNVKIKIYYTWSHPLNPNNLQVAIPAGSSFQRMLVITDYKESDTFVFDLKSKTGSSNKCEYNKGIYTDWAGGTYNNLKDFLGSGKCSCYDVRPQFYNLNEEDRKYYEAKCQCRQLEANKFINAYGVTITSLEEFLRPNNCSCGDLLEKDSGFTFAGFNDENKNIYNKRCNYCKSLGGNEYQDEYGNKVDFDGFLRSCGCDMATDEMRKIDTNQETYNKICHTCQHLDPSGEKDRFIINNGEEVTSLEAFINSGCSCDKVDESKLMSQSNIDYYNTTECVSKKICKVDTYNPDKFIINQNGYTETDNLDLYLDNCDCNVNFSKLSEVNKAKYLEHNKCKNSFYEDIKNCPASDKYEDINDGTDNNYYGFDLEYVNNEDKWNSDYYKMTCTENIIVSYLKGRYKTLAGMQFGFTNQPKMEATKNCVLEVNYTKWLEDYNNQLGEVVAKYNIWKKYAAATGNVIDGDFGANIKKCEVASYVHISVEDGELKQETENDDEIITSDCGNINVVSKHEEYKTQIGELNNLISKLKQVKSKIFDGNKESFYSVGNHELFYNYEQTLPKIGIVPNNSTENGRVNDSKFSPNEKESKDEPNYENKIEDINIYKFEEDGSFSEQNLSGEEFVFYEKYSRKVSYVFEYVPKTIKKSSAYTGKIEIVTALADGILDKSYDTDVTAIAKKGNNTSYVFKIGDDNNSMILKSKKDKGEDTITTTCDYEIVNEIFDCKDNCEKNDPELKVAFRVVDPNNIDPNGRIDLVDKGMKNWKSDKAKAVKDKIKNDALGNNTFNPDKLEYSFTLDSSTLQEIREYNKDQKQNGGYADNSLECDGNGDECKSDFIDLYVSDSVKDISGKIAGRKKWKEIELDELTGKYKIDGVLVN